MTDRDTPRDDDIDAPYARKIKPRESKTDQLAEQVRDCESRQDALIDEAVEESFPASDPATPKRIT